MGKEIALLGGSFNPIHEGHLAMARAARKAGMDQVILLPAGDPPHKGSELESKWDRLEMTRLAAGEEFGVSDIEIQRPGKTYTVDTLECLTRKHPHDRWWMIVGADTLHQISTWKNASRVFELCGFLAFARAGSEKIQVPGARIRLVDTPIVDISSTRIREGIAKGKFLEGFLPKAVEDYIGKKRLYHPPQAWEKEQIEERLRRELKPGRFVHTLGVVETMKRLARAWKMDEEQAALCGLLHDCAKNLSLEDMQKLVRESGMRVDEERMQSEALLHGPAGAARAKAEFGITDPEILQAIRVHTTGCAGMTALDDMLYLADLTEPGRKPFEGLEAVRMQMEHHPREALKTAMEGTLRYVKVCGQPIHPDTFLALEDVKRRTEPQT